MDLDRRNQRLRLDPRREGKHRLATPLLLVAASLLAGPALGAELKAEAILRGRAGAVQSRAPWIEAGFGKLMDGGDADHFESTFQGEAQVGVDLRGGDVLRLHVHGLARTQPSAALGREVGLVEAFVLYRPPLSDSTRLRVMAGMFFPPTSRENTGPLWSSPYTLTLSALNSWIGEEMRLTGAELGVTHSTTRDELLLAGTVFGANDSAGALLSWRGWSLGDRLSSVSELLPLPPLPSLETGGAFAAQHGTLPHLRPLRPLPQSRPGPDCGAEPGGRRGPHGRVPVAPQGPRPPRRRRTPSVE
jgi:hypothetical protein